MKSVICAFLWPGCCTPAASKCSKARAGELGEARARSQKISVANGRCQCWEPSASLWGQETVRPKLDRALFLYLAPRPPSEGQGGPSGTLGHLASSGKFCGGVLGVSILLEGVASEGPGALVGSPLEMPPAPLGVQRDWGSSQDRFLPRQVGEGLCFFRTDRSGYAGDPHNQETSRPPPWRFEVVSTDLTSHLWHKPLWVRLRNSLTGGLRGYCERMGLWEASCSRRWGFSMSVSVA